MSALRDTPTPEADRLAAEALRRFDLPGRLEFVRKVENFVYFLHADDGRALVLRLTEPTHRTPAQIEAELDWMDHLARRGVEVVPPLRDPEGNLVVQLAGEDAGSGPWLACVFGRAPGRSIDVVGQQIDFEPRHVLAWGRAIARMHEATLEYVPSPGVELRHRWDTEPRFLDAPALLDAGDAVGREEHRVLWEWLGALPEDPGAFGLVHCDVHHGNFHVVDAGDGPRLSIFDSTTASTTGSRWTWRCRSTTRAATPTAARRSTSSSRACSRGTARCARSTTPGWRG